jgi:ABC-type molybdate transport system ATPase subunit
MLFASHRREEIEALATRVVTLERGKVIRDRVVRVDDELVIDDDGSDYWSKSLRQEVLA